MFNDLNPCDAKMPEFDCPGPDEFLFFFLFSIAFLLRLLSLDALPFSGVNCFSSGALEGADISMNNYIG